MEMKVYSIENLDCANCAAKAEEKIRRVPGVKAASITFATMQLHLEGENPDELLPLVLAAARQVEPDIVFLEEDHGHHGEYDRCECDHDHHNHGETESLLPLLLGAGVFAAGIVLALLLPQWKLQIIAFVAAYLLLGWDVLKTAGKNLIRGQVFDENFLMSLATLGAFAIGEYPEAVGVMLFYRLGEYFEHRAVERSRKQIADAVDLRPEVVNLFSGDAVTVVAAGSVKVGDLLLVRPGDRIPLDAVVVSGESRIDTAPITGEPVPVSVKPGDNVISGCVNTSGQLTVRVEKILEESMVTRILRSVENAAASKPKMDRFITKFSRIYTPVVVTLALATAVIPSLFDGNWNYWVYTSLSFLVMSCPCALVLSVPLAFFSGIGAGSKQGILFKGGLSIEALAGIKTVALDKTGTLTKGDFKVQQVQGGAEVLQLCASLEQISTHPIAVSITAAAEEQGLRLSRPEKAEEISGHGVCGIAGGKQVICGNEKMMARFGIEVDRADACGGTWVWVAVDGSVAGCIQIADTLKPDAQTAVSWLKKMGMVTAMLTGDREDTAKVVGNAVGVDTVCAGLLPEEKLQQLQQLRNQHGPVMFVGDGINDAPVLSGADVGAAMGSGADAAIEAADVVFMRSQVQAIPRALKIAVQTSRIARQNVIFALAVKAAVMALGALGYASMWAAVFADSGVAMLCVLNAIRLLYTKEKEIM